MCDRLEVGRVRDRVLARTLPISNGLLGEAGLGAVMGEQLSVRRRRFRGIAVPGPRRWRRHRQAFRSVYDQIKQFARAGSIQCRSSNTIRTGWRRARSISFRSTAVMVYSFFRCWLSSSAG
jgi:hypothetical protein